MQGTTLSVKPSSREAGAASSFGQLLRAGAKKAPLVEGTLSKEEREKYATVGDDGYPIPDKDHAVAALALINKGGLSTKEKVKVRKEAHAVLDGKKPKPKKLAESLHLSEHLRINLREAISLDEEKRVATVIILTDGAGNSDDNHYYFPDTVREAAKDKVFDSVQAYADHPTLEEDVIRPERSTRDLIGYYFDSGLTNVKDLNGKNRVAYQAKMQILEGDSFDWVVSLIKESIRHKQLFPDKPPLVGISINADGKFAPGTSPETGTKVNGVTKITRAFSADMVTKPARGGAFVTLKESQRGSRTSPNNEVSMTDKLREAATRIEEQMKRGEIDKDDVTILLEAAKEADAGNGDGTNTDGDTELDEAARTAKDAADKANKDAKDAADKAAKKAADAVAANAGTVQEADRSVVAETAEQLKAKYPTIFATALREAQKSTGTEVEALRTKCAELEASNSLRESAEKARTKLREAKLPPAASERLMHALIGKTDEEQTALIESEKKFIDELKLGTNSDERIVGAGEGRVTLRESETRSNEAALFAGMANG